MRASASRDGEHLVLSTGRIERRFAWRDGALATVSITDLAAGHCWESAFDSPDVGLPGVAGTADTGEFRTERFAGNAAWPPHLRAIVTARFGELELKRVYRLYDGCPAIACDLYLRGRATGPWRQGSLSAYDPSGAAAIAQPRPGAYGAPVVERVAANRRHLQLEIARFFDVTDRRDTLVQVDRLIPYLSPSFHQGNVLLAHDVIDGAGFFLLKEAPCSDMQLAWPGCDFAVQRDQVVVVGLGVDPEELDPRDWVRAYGTVLGLAQGGFDALVQALHEYQLALRVRRPDRDLMIMANTWGDRSQDAVVSEAFALRELEAGRRFGITQLQLDDGWQMGRSGASVEVGGSLSGIWERADWWSPRPERFPNGLGPVVERGRELGIEVGLWFNPSRDDSYAHWRDDAETLIGLYRNHGIRIFKIDGVDIPDKRADIKLRRMFDTVLEATDHELTFNLDTTALRRFGYHYLNEYGTVFLENRYTDFGRYYPHWTLRNLWLLSRWVPAQNLQMEFLNLWRNRDKYPPNDPLAPGEVPFDYAIATTLAAQPLAWLEVQNLPEEAFAAAPLLHTYREHQAAFHAGAIMPLGEEPSGVGWTGFQSLREGQGYLLIYRERNERPTAALRVQAAPGARVIGEPVLGQGSAFDGVVDAERRLNFSLPEPFSFALWRYHLG